MKGSSKVVMGTTMAIVIILAIVLGLVFVLLAELYCSLLFRRKKLHNKAGKAVSATGNPSPLDPNVVPSPLSSFYAQGVLEAPRSFLFPKLPSKREKHHQITEHHDDIENQTHGKLHEFLRVQSPRQIGIASSSLPLQSPSPSYISLPRTKPRKPNHDQEAEIHEENEERFMYISNPIYDNDMVRAGNGETPFETPDSSPSRLDEGSGSESESEEEVGSLPLTPMKNVPAKGGSVALRDARSLGSESNNSHIGRSSSSSASPCTSPSW